MNKTKVETVVDHEQEKQDRLKAESAQRRAEAVKQVRLTFCGVHRPPFLDCRLNLDIGA
jgi:hypothetical protein